MKCPFTGKQCTKEKLYEIIDIKDQSVDNVKLCSDCLGDYLDSKNDKEENDDDDNENEEDLYELTSDDLTSDKISPAEAIKAFIDMIDYIGKPAEQKFKKKIKKCPDCGNTLKDIAKSTRMGCPQCYVTFVEELSNVLKHLHDGKNRHVGKVPKDFDKDKTTLKDDISSLSKEMEEAVEIENYELAAEIRDKLNALKTTHEKIEKLKHKLKRAINSEQYEIADKLKKIIEDIEGKHGNN